MGYVERGIPAGRAESLYKASGWPTVRCIVRAHGYVFCERMFMLSVSHTSKHKYAKLLSRHP